MRASSSNQNCLIDWTGSAIPLVYTNIFLTGVLAMIYSIAATRSVLEYDHTYLALQQIHPLGSSRKLLNGVPD